MLSISGVESRTVTQDALTALHVPELSMHWVEVSIAQPGPSLMNDSENSATIGKQGEQLVAVWLENQHGA